MKICFLEGDMSRRGGTERMTAWLANALVREHKIVIISLKMKDKLPYFSLDQSISHVTLPDKDSKSSVFTQICEIRKILKKEKFDIVINVDVGMCIFGIPAAFGTKTKVITWEHGNSRNNWGSRRFPYFRKFAVKFGDAMVVLTEKDRANYQENFPSRKPICVISNPSKRHEYHYDNESKIILSAGLLIPIKRFELAIEAAAKVLPNHPEWSWVFCGEGSERERLEKLIEKYHLEKQVFLPGSIQKMDDMYQKSAIYVMTSEMEGLPMVLLEAKSWGVPIVSFDIMTGPSDIIRDGVNGYLAESGNIDELAEKIAILIEQPELRRKFSDASQMDMEKFDETEIVKKWETLFAQLKKRTR